MSIMNIVFISVLPVVGIVLGWIVRWGYARYHLTSLEQKAKRLQQTAEANAENVKKELIYETRELLQKEKREQDQEIRNRYKELAQTESRLQKKEDLIDKKLEALEKDNQNLRQREAKIEKDTAELQKRESDLNNKVESIARLTQEEARSKIMELAEINAKKDIIDVVHRIEQEAVQSAEKKAVNLLMTTAQRLVSETTAEMTVSSVDLPNEDMKGRIIGKEGRNIRTIETLTGADVVIDDTPDVVVVSCFNPVRRTIAIKTLQQLIKDGRIHPARIEETVEKVTQNLNKEVYNDGEKMFLELGLQGTMNPELLRIVGRLKFRTSYGQNIFYHSREVAHLAGIMAKEVGADVMIAKRGGLLHDIGKAVDSNHDLSHVDLGVELAKRYNESEEVINCIAAHHHDVPHTCIESVIVQIADAMSASRPGARRDTLENYIERLVKLEDIAKSYEGVDHAYAVHAGRELRVILQNINEMSDAEIQETARQICLRIEDALQYPGRIKVTAIRETRVVEYAR